MFFRPNQEILRETETRDISPAGNVPRPPTSEDKDFSFITKLLIVLIPILLVVGYYTYSTVSGATTFGRTISTPGLEDGLVGHWTFDGSTINGTTVTDTSGNGNNGTLVNNPTPVIGVVGQGIKLDGTDDYVEAGGLLTNYTTFTVTAWVKHDSVSGDDTILDKWSTTKGLQFYRDDVGSVSGRTDIYTCRVTDNDSDNARIEGVSNSSVVDVWIFVACTFLANTPDGLHMYVNGVEDSQSPVATTNVDSIPSFATEMSIGYNKAQSSQPFEGSIDDTRVYNRALSKDEIWTLYQQGKPDKINSADSQVDSLKKGLVGYWKLDEGSGTTAADASGNGNNGTLTNGPTWTSGKLGGGVNFDGTDDYITGANIDIANKSYTVSAWAKRDTATGPDYVFSEGPGGNAIHIGFGGSTNYVCNIWGSNFSVEITNDTNFHLWICAFDAIKNQRTMYRDGVIIGTASGGNFVGSGVYTIGDSPPVGGSYFDGSLDEVRIYNRALSAEEVAKLYKTTAPTEVEAGLVGYWSFNGSDMNGTIAYDQSGKGNNGTLVNGPTPTIGKVGQAMSFDGVDDVVIPLSPDPGDFHDSFSEKTVSAWVKVNSISGPNVIYEEGGNSNGISLTYKSAPKTISFYTKENGNISTQVESISTFDPGKNDWVFVTAVFDNGTMLLYVNGTVEATGAATASSIPYHSDGVGIGYVDGSAVYGSKSWDGSLDEVRVYNRVLSADEVKDLYSKGEGSKI